MLKLLFWLLVDYLLITATVVFAEINGDDNSLTYAAIQQRIAPIGQVSVNDQSQTDVVKKNHMAQRSGKEIYDTVCMLCHSGGAVGAPKFGSHSAWAPRVNKGMNILLQHALNGYNFMPVRGTCLDCSDTEIKAAILYMLDSSH